MENTNQNTGYINPPMTGGYQNPTPPKKDNKKLIAIIAIIAAVVIVAVIAVACVFAFGGKLQNLGSTTGNTQTDNKSNQTGKFDIEEVINNITIDGKPYKWLSSLNDLGTDWNWAEFGKPTFMWGSSDPVATVTYKGEEVFTVSLCDYNEKNERDAMIYSMLITESSSSSYDKLISVDGLIIGDSKQDVLKKYGEPTSCEKSNSSEYLDYIIEKDIESLTIILEDEKIRSIYISYLPKKYRTK